MTRLKSTLLALSLLTASPVVAQTNITGDWDVTVVSPQGANTGDAVSSKSASSVDFKRVIDRLLKKGWTN